MALIKCNECGKEISDKATACPNCGCPTDDNEVAHALINKAINLYDNASTLDELEQASMIFNEITDKYPDSEVSSLALIKSIQAASRKQAVSDRLNKASNKNDIQTIMQETHKESMLNGIDNNTTSEQKTRSSESTTPGCLPVIGFLMIVAAVILMYIHPAGIVLIIPAMVLIGKYMLK